MHKLTRQGQSNIRQTFPESFATVSDGCSSEETHHVEVFASFSAENEVGWKKVLLGFSPMQNKEVLNPEEHYNYVEFVLEVHGGSHDNVAAIVGDRTSTKKA